MNQVLLFRKILFSTLFILTAVFTTYAAEPTLPASNVSFNSQYIDGAQFQLSFSAGNGAGRIVVVKEASDITGKPVDGTSYTSNTNYNDAKFGITGSEIASGEYVVYAGTSTSVTVTGLKPGTIYYVAIFEYNGTYTTPATIDYSPLTPTGQKVTTVIAPTTQASITGFQATGNSVRVNITNGNGSGRIMVARKGNALTAMPTDLTFYNVNSSFKGSTGSTYYFDPETVVVYKSNNKAVGGSTYADVTNLEPNTTYTFAIFEYNSSIYGYTPVYLKPASIQTVTTNAGPTKAATSISFSNIDGNKLTVSCAYGDGKKRMIIAKKGSAVTISPVNGMHYTPNAQFSLGTEMAANSGEYVVYDGASNSVAVINLEKFTDYYFAIYEYDQDSTGFTYYLTSIAPATGHHTTALAPTANTILSLVSVTGSSAQLKYTYPSSGYGGYRLLVIKDGSAIDFLPQDLSVYSPGSTIYGNGKLVAPNTYVVVDVSNGGAPNVTGLTPGHTYYATVFDMNGYYAPVYLTPGSSVSFTIPNEPTTAANNPGFSSVEGNSMFFSWNGGDGARRIVVARKGSAVTSTPTDNTTYTSNSKFGTGSELTTGNGEYVVCDGNFNNVTVTGLEPGTTYYFAVFEYNPSATGPDYLTTAGKWLSASKATISAPTTQTSNLSAYNIQSAQASITFTVGNGSSRIFIMHEGAPVDIEPNDLTSYNTNVNFGTATTQIGTGNYAVTYGGAAFTVYNLKSGTQYYITAFEYNGNTAPVYLRPGATMCSFTTAAGAISAPTQAATSPTFESIDGNKFTFRWSNGNGANRIVIARKGSPVSFVPVNGITYIPNTSFGTGTDLGSQQYIVYNGNANSVSVTNLDPSSTYYFSVYEYNGSGSSILYGGSPLTANHSTATVPTVKSTGLTVTAVSGNLQLSWSNGNGDGRLVVMKEGSGIAGTPAALISYNANASFQNGSQIAVGEYAVYAGSGSSVTVQGLTNGKTYFISVFEYNGINAPVYNSTDVLTGSSSLSTLPVKWLSFTVEEKEKKALLHWSTAEEVNADYFDVQQSKDGINYTSIGKIKASGNTSSSSYYSFADANVNDGTNYYRLKQVDIDNHFTYSPVVSVKLKMQEKICLLQNPVTNVLRIKCTNRQIGSLLMITDASGKVVHKEIVSTTLPVVNVSALTHGLYHVSVINKNGELSTLSFVH